MSALTLQKTPLRQVADVRALLMNEQARDQIAAVASKAMTPERLMRVAANAIRNSPSLQKAEPLSFLGALMLCSQLGLEPNTPLGLAYLIPFNKSVPRRNERGVIAKDGNGKTIFDKVPQVEVVIGYKGFKELVRRTGHLKHMHGDVVYEGDQFSHSYGSKQHLEHIPCGDKAKPLGAYFHVAFDGGEGHVYMTKAEIEAHRDRYSKGWQQAVKEGKTETSPWTKDWEAMWVKTPCRILINRGDVPLSVELAEAASVDENDRLDFRGYAMAPADGLMPEMVEGDTIDGEVSQDAGAKSAEQTKRSRAEIQKDFQRQQAAAKSPPVARREDAQQAGAQATEPAATTTADNVHTESPEAASQDAAQGGPHDGDRAGEGPETSSAHQAEAVEAEAAEEEGGSTGIDLMSFPTAKTIIDDAMDLGADAAREAHARVMEILKAQQPEIYAALLDELERIGG